MALEITNSLEAFQVKGVLDKSNVEKFQSHFKNIFHSTDELVIDINELKRIDHVGVSAFEEIYKQSLINRKPFYITGLGSKEMFEHLKTIDAA
ncbi:STAS domain-containing protein [Oceanihabitans sediminis]|uniref:STAS domain-containing protein n=1 Tax=Oceanihabitans sediminis TaxID=1812012 RepID=A0A368P967_9FLAO|nr:STAS domain-containing protein [Oceanihabitans sediminis]MDX1278421.1 STAS domain-containing protein [Oceanihabitans sediminis]MDX1773980.1 STAS domain-containing protein [Oceanihabitans sediminis]RBP31993.1 STAS domain-containing protein [Oceanihabitans sediminis]RCU58654.1 STAS domain-containing protein [Oceanihabitans sediminis]